MYIIFLGNHESVTMNQMYGFDGEVKAKYPFKNNFDFRFVKNVIFVKQLELGD